MNGHTVQPEQTLRRDPDSFLNRSAFGLLSLAKRTVVITGGARGIGLAFAFACAEVGASVAILDLSEEAHPHYNELAKRFPKQRFNIYKTDVTQYETLRKTFEQVVEDFGSIDGLITAAGICQDEPFLERKPESVARCMNINVLGTYYAAQLAAAQMDKQKPRANNGGRGSIVLIASIAACVASKGQNTSDYCASKGAVLSLAKALYTMTDMTLDLCDKLPHLKHIMTTEPPMRLMADRTDLKGAVVYLLSDASAYQTSDDMLITGGIHGGRLM